MCAVGGKYPVLLPSPYGNCESQPTFSPSSSPLIFRYDKWIFSEEEEESQEILCCRRFPTEKIGHAATVGRGGRENVVCVRKRSCQGGWSNPSQWGGMFFF